MIALKSFEFLSNLFALWTFGKHIANEKYGRDPWEYQYKNKSMHGSDEDFILQK